MYTEILCNRKSQPKSFWNLTVHSQPIWKHWDNKRTTVQTHIHLEWWHTVPRHKYITSPILHPIIGYTLAFSKMHSITATFIWHDCNCCIRCLPRHHKVDVSPKFSLKIATRHSIAMGNANTTWPFCKSVSYSRSRDTILEIVFLQPHQIYIALSDSRGDVSKTYIRELHLLLVQSRILFWLPRPQLSSIDGWVLQLFSRIWYDTIDTEIYAYSN